MPSVVSVANATLQVNHTYVTLLSSQFQASAAEQHRGGLSLVFPRFSCRRDWV